MTPLEGKSFQNHDLGSSRKRLRFDSPSDQMPNPSDLPASMQSVRQPMPLGNSSSSSNIHSRQISNIVENDEASVVKRLAERVAQFVPVNEIQQYGYSKESLICLFDKVGFSFAFLPQVQIVLFKYLGCFQNYAPMLSSHLTTEQVVKACRELLEAVDGNLDQVHEDSLKQFWEMVCTQMHLEEHYRSFSYDEIKSYLQSEESKQLRESLSEMFVGRISILPPEITAFTNLKTLVLDGSLIRERPHIALPMKDLKIHHYQNEFWRYSNTSAWEIPSLIRMWPRIHKQYPSIPMFATEAEMEQWVDSPRSFWVRSEVRELDLSNLGLTEFPSALGKFSNLTCLNLSGNALTSIPDSIGNLNQLDKLYLTGNALDTLPKAMASLRQLTVLDISENKFEEIPSAIKHLDQLKTLEMIRNEVRLIPDWICRFRDLRRFRLDYNLISTLPDEISDLRQLEIFTVRHNRLSQIPASMEYLSKLSCLYVDQNPDLKEIPEMVCHLPLKEFFCDWELYDTLPQDTCIKIAYGGERDKMMHKRKR